MADAPEDLKSRHSKTVSIGDAGSLFGASSASNDFFGALSNAADSGPDRSSPLTGIGEEPEDEVQDLFSNGAGDRGAQLDVGQYQADVYDHSDLQYPSHAEHVQQPAATDDSYWQSQQQQDVYQHR
jgi:hypothetical protein